jgi:hypothetical protein
LNYFTLLDLIQEVLRHQLTPLSTVIYHNLIIAQVANEDHFCDHKIPVLDFVLGQIKIHLNIILLSAPRSVK